MADQAIAASIPVHERTEALALIHDGGRCYGAVVRDLITGQLTAYVAKATAIATGGAGWPVCRPPQPRFSAGIRAPLAPATPGPTPGTTQTEAVSATLAIAL